MLNTPVGRLRAVGYAEGTSFLALLGVAMPLKYLADLPKPVLYVGWAHGVLFMLYLAAAAHAALAGRWRWTRVLAAGVVSVVPFGPFVFDTWLRREEKVELPGTPARP